MSVQKTAEAAAPTSAAAEGNGRTAASPFTFLVRYGVFAVFVVMLVVFATLKPQAFLQLGTLRAILVDAAVLGVVAAALTPVLAIGEFDLSFGNVAGLAGAVAVYAMYTLGIDFSVAILAAILVGVAAGACNGIVVSYGRVPALIATLAVGSMALGLERSIMNDNTVYDGIPAAYVALTEMTFLGMPSIVVISLLVVAALSFVSSFTVFGRRVYAIGGSDEAARIAGIRTNRVRFTTFVVMGVAAALAGVLLTSQAASYYPRSGVGLLLPAFAACFLGWSAAGANRFYPAYTYFGVLFMGTLSTGLIMLQVPSWVDDLVQGAVLVSAVLVARAARAK